MSTTTTIHRPSVSTPVAAPPPANKPATPAPPTATAKPTSDAWAGDHVALAAWLIGATIIGFLLLKDLLFAMVPR